MSSGGPRARVVLERLRPVVESGLFPVKRVQGESLDVSVVAFTDGHDKIAVDLVVTPAGASESVRQPMIEDQKDVFQASHRSEQLGSLTLWVEGWVDHWETWRSGTLKKAHAGLDIGLELRDGRALLAAAKSGADAPARMLLEQAELRLAAPDAPRVLDEILSEDLSRAMRRYAPRAEVTRSASLTVWVEPLRARFTAWYEFFPRSASPDPSRPGTLQDALHRLEYVAQMGFDTVYFPPIHPIGRIHRKGKNNARTAEDGDTGSPWAIGAEEGGHTAIHPDLGTFEDFDALVRRARDLGLEVALDIAFQCAPDHPWVREHPNWFRQRADGSIQYAENPPKKYEDIYPLDFETDDWEGLWHGLRDVFLFWMERGVHTFRVDNPHTKAFSFWTWVVPELKKHAPELVLLSEAFARPNIARRLAKVGFTQSYSYFPWKNGRYEIETYFKELASPESLDYFRPSCWVNTPDILNEYLQAGGRAGATVRAVLAATLSASYGVYGPVFELGVSEPREPGSEEYRDSEKYQVRHWDLDASHSLAPLLRQLNAIRRSNSALQTDRGLEFLPSTHPGIVAFVKRDAASTIAVVVNVDPHQPLESEVEFPVDPLSTRPFQVHDLLSDERFVWTGPRHRLRLDPASMPAKILRMRAYARTESDFDYFQ
ncbi:MAG: alpha-1,4-glucan--maltose-1-phosphate maltosyltransferase [Myxococcota bacterium]